jgi:hypothetical protein
MTATTSKLGADMTDEQIESARGAADKECPLGPVNVRWYRAFARALLARQPAAIDKEAVAWIFDDGTPREQWTHIGNLHFDGPNEVQLELAEKYGWKWIPLYAAPLATEASKPAPSVEQGERGTFEAWARDEGMDLERGIIGAGAYNDSSTQACWRGWKHRARAASTSANVAQERDDTEPRDEYRKAAHRAIGYVMAMDGPMSLVKTLSSMASGDISDSVATGAEAQTLDDLSALVVRLVRALRKASPDGDLPEKALGYLYRKGLAPSVLRGGAFGEFAAPPAQTERAQGEKLAVGWFVQRSSFGPWIEVEKMEPGAVQLYQTTSQPAQTALTDDARDAARYRLLRRGQHWSVIDGIGDILRSEKLDATIDAALAAAQSASGDTK